jgi:cytochrome c556
MIRAIRTPLAACCMAAILAPLAATQALADDGERAMWARQGFMNLVSWEIGPLFGMAKGDMPYDAEAAKTHAARLKALYTYPFPSLFIEGTSKEDRPGKTRALPEIWKDQAKFDEAFKNIQAAIDALPDKVGVDQPTLAAAVSEIGKSCGGCHQDFRAKDY